MDQLRTAMGRSVEGFSMLDALVAAVDNKDRYTRRHSEDVLAYSLQVAEALGLDEPTRAHRRRRPPCCTTSARSASPTPSSASRAR